MTLSVRTLCIRKTGINTFRIMAINITKLKVMSSHI
jgi:hypothetical protein